MLTCVTVRLVHYSPPEVCSEELVEQLAWGGGFGKVIKLDAWITCKIDKTIVRDI